MVEGVLTEARVGRDAGELIAGAIGTVRRATPTATRVRAVIGLADGWAGTPPKGWAANPPFGEAGGRLFGGRPQLGREYGSSQKEGDIREPRQEATLI